MTDDDRLSNFLGSEVPQPGPGYWDEIDARLRRVEDERQSGEPAGATTAATAPMSPVEQHPDPMQNVEPLVRPTVMSTSPQRPNYLLAVAAAVLVVAAVGGALAIARNGTTEIGTATLSEGDATGDPDPSSTPDDDGGPVTPVTVGEETPDDTTIEDGSATTTSPEETTTTVPPTETTNVVQVAADEQATFVTPSGNISCLLSNDLGVSCIVFEHEWTIAAPTEADCEFDWGDEVGLGPDGVTFGCYSDVFWDTEAPTAAYGTAFESDDYRCEVARTGVTCRNSTGNGFAVARATLEQF